MTVPQKVTLACVAHALPFSSQTVYNAHSQGRWTWLSRVGPDGRRSRELWVDLPSLNIWAAERGQKINLSSLQKN